MKRLSALAAITLALACGGAFAEDKVVATINGKSIHEAELEAYRAERESPVPASREQLIDELVARELVYQDALARNLDKDAKVQKEMEELRQRVLMSAAVRTALEKNPVTDDEIKAEYETIKGQLARKEFKARHILVDSEEKAKEVVVQLNKGTDFTELARKHSSGPTGKNGGELGWFTAEQMVPPFAEAVRGLKKGAYTKAPVQTQYGWHVILLEDTRNVPAPGLAEVKERLRAALQQRHIAKYVEDLKKQAKVTVATPATP